jgi:hypothetical protein
MGVRIDRRSEGERTIIQISGELRGQVVVELERLCRETPGPLSLDLSNLRSSESEGVQLIRELAAQGVVLSGVTPYLRLLLTEHS